MSYVATYPTPTITKQYSTITNNIQIPDASSNVIDFSFLLRERKKMKNLDKLKIISKLEHNWNRNEASPFSRSMITSCFNLINHLIIQPEIFPTGRQSVQFEYEKENGAYLEFELFEDKINLFIIQETGEEIEDVMPLDINKINEMVLEFYE